MKPQLIKTTLMTERFSQLSPNSITYAAEPARDLRIRALMNMGTPLDAPLTATRMGIDRLTPGELQVCVMHFADGRSQTLIAQWLGTSRRAVQMKIQSAVVKVPELRPLQTKSRFKPKRPRLLHLSQLNCFSGREPFNIDDI